MPPSLHPIATEPASGRLALVFDPESLVLDPTADMEHRLLRCTMSDRCVRIPYRWFARQWTPSMSLPQTLSRGRDTRRAAQS